jgi:hypothetical protein
MTSTCPTCGPPDTSLSRTVTCYSVPKDTVISGDWTKMKDVTPVELSQCTTTTPAYYVDGSDMGTTITDSVWDATGKVITSMSCTGIQPCTQTVLGATAWSSSGVPVGPPGPPGPSGGCPCTGPGAFCKISPDGLSKACQGGDYAGKPCSCELCPGSDNCPKTSMYGGMRSYQGQMAGARAGAAYSQIQARSPMAQPLQQPLQQAPPGTSAGSWMGYRSRYV